MSQNEDARALEDAAKAGRFLTGRMHISRVWYFVGVCCEILILLVGVMAAAGLNNPTGGGSIFLAVIFPAIALWIHICLVIGRVRDAEGHWFLGLLLGVAPFAWIAVTLEYIEYIGFLMAIVFVALYALPAFFKPKPAAETQA
jgi:uncharacterized membrane protein YhaH (DUF805 family)